MITITHTSPELITKITSNGGCTESDVLFFSLNDYQMSVGNVYVYDMQIDESKIISVSQLYCENVVAEVAALFSCDEDDAESILDSTKNEWDFDSDAEKSWRLQGLRARAAKNMGYIAVEDTDENGVVYIICMTDLESKLVQRH